MDKKYDLNEYVERLYCAALKKTGDSYSAEEISQETLLAAVKMLNSGKTPENLWSWLLTVLSNKYCDLLREKYARVYVSFDEYPVDLPAEDEVDDDDGQLEAVKRELGYLAELHRGVLVRFYFHGEGLEQISRELNIPLGTVKSRLSIGRRLIRERVTKMENYVNQSCEPEMLHIACSGGVGLNKEPFSLVGYSDLLTQNVLIAAYEKPLTVTEIARKLATPSAFIEPILKKLTDGELMKQTEGGKYYTDFIIYTEKDRRATFDKQLECADSNFELFWGETGAALMDLRERGWYKRQSGSAKQKLELHFLVKLLVTGCIIVRDEVTGVMPYEAYPYRKNGGRWLGIGNQYPHDYDFKKNGEYWKYSFSGEADCMIKNFRGAKSVDIRGYETDFGNFNERYGSDDFIKWIYELYLGVPYESSEAAERCVTRADTLIEKGVLKRDGGLQPDIPVLSADEYMEEQRLVEAHENKLAADIRTSMIKLFDEGYVKLPPHLKSVPKWQQYMHCGDSVPMAVIFKAMEKKRLFEGVDCPLPAVIMVIDK